MPLPERCSYMSFPLTSRPNVMFEALRGFDVPRQVGSNLNNALYADLQNPRRVDRGQCQWDQEGFHPCGHERDDYGAPIYRSVRGGGKIQPQKSISTSGILDAQIHDLGVEKGGCRILGFSQIQKWFGRCGIDHSYIGTILVGFAHL